MTRRILTGTRTTGPSHVGHYAGAYSVWLPLQDQYECFFLLADIQAFTTHFEEPALIEESVREVTLDWLAVGLDPLNRPNVHFVIQSQVPELAELSVFFSFLTPTSYIDRNPTIKTERKDLGARAMNLGFYSYPVSQAADILVFTPLPRMAGDELLVPVGEDQIPHLELTNVIARNFNRTYQEVFIECRYLVSQVPRLMGTDGGAKMGKSLGNAISLSEDLQSVERKVMSMYTDPTRIHATDPGHVEGNPVFQYHDAFNGNKEEVAELKERYRAGRVGDVEVKRRLFRALSEFLGPIQERRTYFAAHPDLVSNVLVEGTAAARQIAQRTMEEVRAAMHVDYPGLLQRRKSIVYPPGRSCHAQA